jgi:hypothetical protein
LLVDTDVKGAYNLADYRIHASPNPGDAELIYATHPAPAGTYIVYANEDGSTSRTPVLLWGVLDDGTAVPITLSGVWDGVSNQNNFVLHPDGLCGKYQEEWSDIKEAVEALRQFGS